MRKKSERFTLEGSQKLKLCFPCSVRSIFFELLMEHGKHIFEIDLTPTVKMIFFKGGWKLLSLQCCACFYSQVCVFNLVTGNVALAAATGTLLPIVSTAYRTIYIYTYITCTHTYTHAQKYTTHKHSRWYKTLSDLHFSSGANENKSTHAL